MGDVRTAEVGGGYDFILAQLLLHHLPERSDVVARLSGFLRPGGWLIVDEPDVRFMWTYGAESPVAWYETVLRKFVELGADYACGMEIPAMMRDASLQNIDGGLWTPLIAADSGVSGSS